MKIALGGFLMGAMLGAFGLLGMDHWVTRSNAPAQQARQAPPPNPLYIIAARQ